MLVLQEISYLHPDKVLAFDQISLNVNNHDKIALIGHNGVGKSTLLKIIAGELQPSGGLLSIDAKPYYVPQIFGQYNNLTIAQALRVEDKLSALHEILNGQLTEENYALLDEDWTIEDRCQAALSHWQLRGFDLSDKMEKLSGGQKTKVFLAGISIHQPELVLLDEPSNHLDLSGRQLLYHFIQSSTSTLVVVSHDRKILNLLHTSCELSSHGVAIYGGNYDFYAEKKQIAHEALNHGIQNMEKALRKAREKERETMERQQKLDARGKKKQEKAGVARIMMNSMRNNAENSSSKMSSIHTEKIGGLSQDLQQLRSALPDFDQMKFGFEHSGLYRGKTLFRAEDINFSYSSDTLWIENLSFQIASGERIAIKGHNGSGKTTLIKLILGDVEPQAGSVYRADNKAVYIDQDYSLIDDRLKVYEQAQHFNTAMLQEHEVKIRLNRFLFTKDDWEKPCRALSGGEKMRLMLCCLTIASQSPDLIILDEPTNNLDIQNIEMLTSAINEYQGTLIAISHDESFLEQLHIERVIQV